MLLSQNFSTLVQDLHNHLWLRQTQRVQTVPVSCLVHLKAHSLNCHLLEGSYMYVIKNVLSTCFPIYQLSPTPTLKC